MRESGVRRRSASLVWTARMTVGWTSNARRELGAIHDYIAENSPRYDQGMVNLPRNQEFRW